LEVVSGLIKDLFDHQTVIMKLLANPTTRMLKDDKDEMISLLCCLEVYRLGLELGVFYAEGDRLLATYCAVHERTLKTSGYNPHIMFKNIYLCEFALLGRLAVETQRSMMTSSRTLHAHVPPPEARSPKTTGSELTKFSLVYAPVVL